MKSLSRWIPVAVLSGFALILPALAQDEAPARGEELCAPRGVTIPFAAASPRSWNTWVSSTDLKDTYCNNVAVTEIRSRAKKNAQGELEVTFKVTTYTKPGHDKRVDLTIEVLAADRVLKSTTIERIDAEEKKNAHGTGFLVVPVDLLPADADARLRVSIEAVEH
jgi:hypothetical protein